MERFKKLALKRPFLFGLVLIFIYAILGTLTYPVHFLFPENELGQLHGDALAKLIIFLAFLLILARFGWMKASGITWLGNVKIWLIVGLILIYQTLALLYAFTGDISVVFPKSQMEIANLLVNLPTSLVEETMFRGLVLVAMIIVWGNRREGQIKALFLSSLFFGLIHLLNILVRPFGVVFFQATVVVLQGMILATLVLAFRTLWPAIIIHWLTNAAVNIKLVGYVEYQETFSMWIIFAISLIPLMVYAAYLVWKLPQSYRYETIDSVDLSVHRPAATSG